MEQYKQYKRRYEGPRWVVCYGSYENVERFALEELYKMVQRYQPYVLVAIPASTTRPLEEEHLILIGTRGNNPLIADLVSRGHVAIPDKAQAYAIACLDSPWKLGQRVIVITGSDGSGVLYGVEEFAAHVLMAMVNPEKPNPERLRQVFDAIPTFNRSGYPLIEERGIWAWGFPIYDYRRWFDKMARLKLNYINLWNDQPPLNCQEMIDYARSRGVKVILGCSWGWQMQDMKEKLTVWNPAHRQAIKALVLEDYRRYYQDLDFDGLYFQTQTEHMDTVKEGRRVAETVCELINDIAADIHTDNPNIRFLFGVHATSILDSYTDLEALDPRIEIVWEDAGDVPFAYPKVPEGAGAGWPFVVPGCETPEKTLEYARKLATFRPGTTFAMVHKGWTSQDWAREWEHHGPFLIGIRDADFITERLRQRRPILDDLNALWLQQYPIAARFYRGLLETNPASKHIELLYDDGLFEEEIPLTMAICAEILWNPCRADSEFLQLGLSPYYRMR